VRNGRNEDSVWFLLLQFRIPSSAFRVWKLGNFRELGFYWNLGNAICAVAGWEGFPPHRQGSRSHASSCSVGRATGCCHGHWCGPVVHPDPGTIGCGVNTRGLWPGWRSASLQFISATGGIPGRNAVSSAGLCDVPPAGVPTTTCLARDNATATAGHDSQASAETCACNDAPTT
jgi:hypothetical protein